MVIPVASGVVRIGEWREPLPGPLVSVSWFVFACWHHLHRVQIQIKLIAFTAELVITNVTDLPGLLVSKMVAQQEDQ